MSCQLLSTKLSVPTDAVKVTWKGLGTTPPPDATLLRSIGFYNGMKLLVATSSGGDGGDVDAASATAADASAGAAFDADGSCWGGDLAGMKTPPRPAPTASDITRHSSGGVQAAGASSPVTPTPTRKLADVPVTPLPNSARGLLLSAMSRSPGRTPPSVVSYRPEHC